MAALTDLWRAPTRHLFFTGKGGVGKTSLACATAIALADLGRRVLLVSTDPASNLDEVLDVPLGPEPTPIASVPGLEALNLDPEAAARAYRERIVGPYRGKLPASAVTSIEEQLSGACTVEIAAFDEFAKLLGNASATRRFDHVVFDTAPTGHTLRLLSLPAAWTGYLQANPGAGSCLGPLGGLAAQRELYAATVRALADASVTTLVLVTRPEVPALDEAERTRAELAALGVSNQRLIVNGLFAATDRDDPVACALEARGRAAMSAVPDGLGRLERSTVPLSPRSLVGVPALRRWLQGVDEQGAVAPAAPVESTGWAALVGELEQPGQGVIMTMGKGGVGKTTIAAALATELARRGHRVHLTTTDPAAHVAAAVGTPPPNLRVSRIDPAAETAAYMAEVRDLAAPSLDEAGRALLEEDLRSPCTEEIAVFRAFARTVATGEDELVVVDTAPTGHTLAAPRRDRDLPSRGRARPGRRARRRQPALAAAPRSAVHARAHRRAARRDSSSRGDAPRRGSPARRHSAVRLDRQPELRRGPHARSGARRARRSRAAVHRRGARRERPLRRAALDGRRVGFDEEVPMMRRRVLFVCVHNSARSQMAEAFLAQMCPDELEVASAGLEPTRINPLVVEVMKEVGIDLSQKSTQAVWDLAKKGALFAYVISVCAEAGERCPIFPGVCKRLAWSFDDPGQLDGTHEEKLAGTRVIRDQIRAEVARFCDAQCAVRPARRVV